MYHRQEEYKTLYEYLFGYFTNQVFIIPQSIRKCDTVFGCHILPFRDDVIWFTGVSEVQNCTVDQSIVSRRLIND